MLMFLLLSALLVSAQDTSSRAQQAYARAIELDRQGNHPAALVLLWEAAGLAPGDPDVQNRLGEALDRIGALDAAIDAFRRALAARPGFRLASKNLVLTLVKAGRGPEAIEHARALVRTGPADPDAHFTLGLAQSEQDVAAALATFRRVLELAPDHGLARYNLALVLKRLDRPAEAIDELRRTIRIAPRSEAQYTLGVIHWQQGDLERAERALRAAVAAQPEYADAHYTLGAVLGESGDVTGAVASLRRAIALRPDLWSARYTLARVLRDGGDEPAARAQLVEAERLRQRAAREHEASVATAVGTAKLEAGDLAGALEQFERAITIDDRHAPAHYQKGRTLQRLGLPDASRAAFARARQLNPSLVPPG
jgi:tetratricopeptide (TPR) repeat protein